MSPHSSRTLQMRRRASSDLSAGRTYRELVDGYEKSVILIALAATQGNQRRTAELLGLLPSTLNEKMRRFRIRAIDAVTAEAVSSPSSRATPL